MKYAIIGNPNCGKTTLFNALTGLKQKVGNWSGVTVDRKVGYIESDNQRLEIVDLPGIYTLTTSDQSSIDEQIASRFIVEDKPDAIINVIDASNLERNLYLTMQLIETEIPVILAINMIDVANKKGIVINYQKLQETLGCMVVPVIGRKKVGIDELKSALFQTHSSSCYTLEQYYPNEINALTNTLTELTHDYPNLWLATSLAEDNYLLKTLFDGITYERLQQLKAYFKLDQKTDIALSTARYKAIENVIKKVCKTQAITPHKTTELIDKVCMNKYLGIPIFLFVMYLMFEFSITIGGALQPLFDNTSNIIFIEGMTHLSLYLGLPLWLVAVIAQGIGLGINTVLTFIPQIGCMFLFLSFLEDSGYMARAAYVMDRFMQAIGLPGKAFVPLIVGFGCNVPSVMAARTLETRRDRLMTIMMAPFMSCGARLAIFAVFAAAFFPHNSAFIIFSLYIAGIIGAIVTGYVVKFALLTGQSTPFVMELPVYHLPNLKTICFNSWDRLKRFIFRAGKVIIPICVLVGTLNSIETNGQVIAGGSPQSILAETGRAITPILKPMGVSEENWQATVGLLTGTLAKEVVVGTLNTLYTQEKPQSLAATADETFDLLEGLAVSWYDTVDSFKNMNIGAFINPFSANESDANMDKTAMGSMIIAFGSLAAAFSYMLFVLLYVPCASVIGAMAREATRGWAVISVIWSTSIAYTAAVISYQLAQLTIAPLHALSWILAVIIYMAMLVIIMKRLSQKLCFKLELNQTCLKDCGTTAKVSKVTSNCH
ncbi:Fe(2+) transporter permease subunit FeoB [Fastidiosibacter lacustris]|uniref:Fe(2+) transporter permease subunit FeoB n=1 Tax=Fastidiosibacter lacustris TaxID=2056695 RepID=UPI000E350C00|nr:Fe(2+) transporter permease subunit FeoB [Fastidiosibacter lacustris]